MSRFDSVVVGNDLVSEHWLAEQFPATVKAQRTAWKDREDHGKTTPRSGLLSLGTYLATQLVRFREQGDVDKLREWHASVRAALGFSGDETVWSVERGGQEVAVPTVVVSSPTGTHLLVVQARDARSVEDLLDVGDGGAGHLLAPAVVAGVEHTGTAKAVSEIFAAEEPPALVLVTAGGWLLLAERGSWPEGRWLAVDLATALERRDARAGGELETIAALVSADSLTPVDDGTTPFLTLLDDSVKHAVGVSKDLRDGVRESIELLASEVLRRRRARGLPSDADGPAIPSAGPRLAPLRRRPAGHALAADLTRQSLRYLYRILFLLYAEARPELGVLPVGTPEYAEGYGLDRLRELALVTLTSDAARDRTHLHQSLAMLFQLVNNGYPPATLGPDGTATEPPDDGGLRFEALRADLFSPEATALIDEVGLGDGCLQGVLSRLLLTKKQRNKARGFVSYAQFGINQLGAVYEGLMSYTGSIAGAHMVEVAKDGDPAKGSWVVPEASTRDFDPTWFVERKNPDTGLSERVRYAPGDFVFRLSGRDRQRSASYYTPEVLTRCVVTHSLAELLTDDTPAATVLDLRVCEPTLGSGAFLVEAINQLATQYLTRRQKELDRRIDPEAYAGELQKVKAYLALHNCYGVDLNATAVELAEITLWLDAMHPGLRAPWFGLHLRRGNSLIGGRRETWTPAQLAKRGWLTTVPTARPLGEPVAPTEVHHFLLPAAGWGAVADTKEAKEGRPNATTALKAWRRTITGTLTSPEQKRLQALGQRVEALWALAQRRLEVAESEIRRHIDVWGADNLPVGTGAVQREQIEASLTDPNSAYRRLRRVLDAWAALWFWPITASVPPPTRDEWIGALEALLGTMSRAEARKGRGLFADDATWAELDVAEHTEVAFAQMKPLAEVVEAHPWLAVCEQIAEKEGFFHWELDFAPVFAQRGGFDLQVGNPPWVRPDWDDNLVLAEDDAWFGLADKPAVSVVRERRDAILDDGDERYLDERASVAGTSAHMGSAVDRPILAGTQPDLYRCLMERTWRLADPSGIVGLVHPDSHFTEARASHIRRNCYMRLRRLWQFKNELRLFEVGNQVVFSVSIYGCPSVVNFMFMASLFSPATVDRSLVHDGSGSEPGLREDAGWDIRPHRGRIIRVTETVLETWRDLIDAPDAPPQEARMIRPVNAKSQAVLRKMAQAVRFETAGYRWSRGWKEDDDRRAGIFELRSAVPSCLSDLILQGPHFAVASPYAKEGSETMRSNKDYVAWDLETLSQFALPRANYQRLVTTQEFEARYPRWDGRSSRDSWRIMWRNMTVSGNERSLFPAVFPPGPTHVHAVHSLATASLADLALASGVWASIVVEFFVKVSGVSKIQAELIERFPHPREHALVPEVILRAVRLNCLTAHYAPFWAELFDPAWRSDSWTRAASSAPLGDVTPTWTMATPLRKGAERRQALVEIDALAAVMLGITAEELCAIYRTQFGVLRKYERVMQFDRNGRQVPKDVLKEYEKHGTRADLGRYELPFTGVNREAEMTIAHEEFSRRAVQRGAHQSGVGIPSREVSG